METKKKLEKNPKQHTNSQSKPLITTSILLFKMYLDAGVPCLVGISYIDGTVTSCWIHKEKVPTEKWSDQWGYDLAIPRFHSTANYTLNGLLSLYKVKPFNIIVPSLPFLYGLLISQVRLPNNHSQT